MCENISSEYELWESVAKLPTIPPILIVQELQKRLRLLTNELNIFEFTELPTIPPTFWEAIKFIEPVKCESLMKVDSV